MTFAVSGTKSRSLHKRKDLTSHDFAEEAIMRIDDLSMNLLDFCRALGSENYVLISE